MKNTSESSQLLDLLNQALERELQVSVQYMMQHGIAAGQKEVGIPLTSTEKQHNFVATHFPYFLPGNSLKKNRHHRNAPCRSHHGENCLVEWQTGLSTGENHNWRNN